MTRLPAFNDHPYEIIQELGCNREGGRVSYLATQTHTDCKVVIKQFRFAQSNANWQGFKAYQQEINVLQQLDHPRIPRYLDSFETDDGFCMVQEYQEAPSLAVFQHHSPQDIKTIAVSILEILVDLQSRRPLVIHRDIKPENILVDAVQQAYLIDFGLARIQDGKVALSSVAAGTPGFMPPEELFNRPLTPAADLYSLGATLIGVLTQTPSVEIGHLIDDDYRFKLPSMEQQYNPQFLAWLQKMVEPQVKDRFADAAEALAILKPIDITDVTIASDHVTPRRMAVWIVGGGALVLGTLVWKGAYENMTQLQSTTKPTSSISQTHEQQWFQAMKPHCNSLEVTTAVRRQPYPKSTAGVGYAASCYALAGKIDQADQLIQKLSPDARWEATRVVFEIGHPVADAGDDESAGPIMELVLKYWPNNYMARYHAGMSAYVLGQYVPAEQHLQQFVRDYHNDDPWRQTAQSTLDKIRSSS